MAEVFLARAGGPRNFERLLVIKRILPQFSADEEFVEMFVAEAKISALLHHGNIVQVFEFGEIHEQLFLAMEYVDGTDLRAVRKARPGPLPPHVAAFIAMQTLNALAYAHGRCGHDGQPLRIVHRDVSPANILLSRSGEVKLCDFGIARFADRQTAAATLKGKFGYLSPEQVHGEPLDARSDLFSVGVVLWEMLAGERLFAAESGVGILEKVRILEVPELAQLTAPGDGRLRSTVRRALQREPAQRHRDAWGFAEELAQYLAAAHAGDPVAALREIVAASPHSAQPSTPPSQSGVVTAPARAPSGARRAVPPERADVAAPPRPASRTGDVAAPPRPASRTGDPGAAPPAAAEMELPRELADVPEPEVRDTLPPEASIAPVFVARGRTRVLIAALAVALSILVATILVWLLLSGPDPAELVASPLRPAVVGQPSSEVPAPPPLRVAPASAAIATPTAEPAAPSAAAPELEPLRPVAPGPPGRRTRPAPEGSPGTGSAIRPPPAKERMIDPFALGSGR
jgi:hypothetical protein